MNTPGRLERHLKRRNVLGNETDMFQSLFGYNRSLASAMTSYELGHELAEADNDLETAIRDEAKREYNASGTLIQQSMASELRGRIADINRASGPKILSVVKDITFLRHLASPHYTMIQLTQPFMMTLPIATAKYGRLAAWTETMRVMSMGARRSLGRGLKETGQGLVALVPGTGGPRENSDYDTFWKDEIIKGQKDEAFLRRVIDAVVELGFGASSGIEASDSGEVGMNKGEVALKRMVDVARALPEAAESVNRYSTAIMIARLAKRSGMSEEQAIREAVLTVEETQGGYGAANNPAFFNQPLLAPAVQFRKFSLAYGQLYYRNLHHAFSHADPEQRKIARKSVARLSLAVIATAGAFGLAPIEIARTLVNIAALLGLKDDDWETDENEIQEWVSEFLGKGMSEALFRGAPRLANLDLSGSLSVDNLAMFGQPKELNSEGIQEWLFKAAFGASGAVMFKSLDEYQQSDSVVGGVVDAIPWPKVIKNLIDAKELAFTGTVDKKTGEEYMPPVGVIEAVYKGLRSRTASEAREWEAGGGGYENRQDKAARYDRRILMGRWANATGSERHDLWNTEIRQWNKDHPGDKDLKIDMGDLQRSKKERKRRQKEREKEREED